MSARPAWLFGVLLALGSALLVLAHAQPFTSQAQASPAAGRPSSRVGPGSVYRLQSSWETDDGRTLELADLRGDFQVLALIFTRCGSVCPSLVRELRSLERRMPERARASTRFTLVSIDPEHDTPEVLAAYRRQQGLDERFTLLRGDLERVRELAAVLGFSFGAEPGAPIAHSTQVTLLGPEGQLLHQQAGIAADPNRIIELISGAP